MLIDKLPDTGNLALGALVFGQYISDRPFSLRLAIVGCVGWVALFAWGLLLGEKDYD
jgi:hypothetical protein